MTKELTNDVKWLREKAGTVLLEGESNGLARIADRLEQLAAENEKLTNQRDQATAEVVNYCAGYRKQLAEMTAERDKLRAALETIVECDTAAVKELEAIGIKPDTSLVELARTALGKEE